MNEPGGEDLFAAIGHALTGEALTGTGAAGAGTAPPPTPQAPLDAAQVVARLADAGWGATRLQAHRALCQHERRPWPHPVPEGLVTSWGRYGSLLRQVRLELGLDGLHQQVHQGPRVLGPAELRLLADKPPHHL